MIKIEKNIPLPENFKRGRREKYPLFDMVIGDSFFVPKDHRTLRQLQMGISANMWSRIAKRKSKIKVSVLIDNTNKGVRVWRIK